MAKLRWTWREAVDLVITDLVMEQEASKPEGCTAWTGLPVIAIAGCLRKPFERCAMLGASATLAKPIEPEELLSTVAQFVRPPGGGDDPVEIGGEIVNTGVHGDCT